MMGTNLHMMGTDLHMNDGYKLSYASKRGHIVSWDGRNLHSQGKDFTVYTTGK